MAVLSVSRCVLSLGHRTAWVLYLVLLSNFLGARLLAIELLMLDLGLWDIRLICVSVSLYAYVIKPNGRTNVEAAGFHYIYTYKHTIYSIDRELSVLSVCPVGVCYHSVIELLVCYHSVIELFIELLGCKVDGHRTSDVRSLALVSTMASVLCMYISWSV